MSLDHSHSANPCLSDISRPENPRSGICSGVHTQFLANSVWDNGTFCKHAKQMSPPKAPKWAKDPPNRPWLTWVHFWGPWLMGLKGLRSHSFTSFYIPDQVELFWSKMAWTGVPQITFHIKSTKHTYQTKLTKRKVSQNQNCVYIYTSKPQSSRDYLCRLDPTSCFVRSFTMGKVYPDKLFHCTCHQCSQQESPGTSRAEAQRLTKDLNVYHP